MTKTGFFSFPRAFYVINGIELLERGAFYSMNAVLAVFMATTLALPAVQIGVIASVLFFLLYTIPLLGAAIGQKFGFKVALVISFAFLAIGYAATLVASDFTSILLAVVGIGLGAGVFKPIAAAAVSQASSVEQRNYAFMIYYGAINLGAVVFPFAVGIVGIFAPELLSTVAFGVAAILSGLNLVLCLTVWRNILPPQKDKSVLQSLAGLGEVFRHPKFLILLVIYSGFWFLYAMSLSFVAVYMIEFGRLPGWFNVALMNVINPLVIVILAPFLGGITKGFSSIGLMIAGISLYVVGFITLGFSTGWMLFVGGIIIYSVGEVLTHPSFLAYVSKIAPPDRVAVFLSYGFLPIAFGLFFGAGVGGVLYARFAQQAGTPAIFWAIMSGVALITVAALLIYNRFVEPRPKAVAPGPGEERPARRGFGMMGTFGLAALALLLVPALVMAAALVPGQTANAAQENSDPISAASLTTVELDAVTDTATEGDDTKDITFTFPEGATGSATFTLTWQDEAVTGPAGVNAPDTFKLIIMRPDMTQVESPEESSGTLEFTIDDITPGDYMVMVQLVDAGDQSAASTPLGPVPVGGAEDTSNEFTLAGDYQSSG